MRSLFRNPRHALRRANAAFGRKSRPTLELLEDRSLLDAGYLQTNLVSDVPGLATSTDPNLKNPWGLVASPNGPWWVSDNATGVSTLYNGAGQAFPIGSPLVVNIPTGPGTPTGIVFNGNSSEFIVTQGGSSGPAFFIFATANGTISAWSPAISFTNAITVVNNSAFADYEGLALANNGSGDFLYGTDFATGNIDVFNSQFQPTTLAGSFTDPNLPAGFTPYGIQSLDGNLYVTYVPNNFTPGGLIDVFDTNGNFVKRLVTGGNLDFPWGMAIAPHNFGRFSNALLVGNVFDGHIDAYNPHTGAFRGQLADAAGNPFTEPGLWSLKFGNDGLAGDSDTLFFTAGINNYADGLFGSLQPNHHAARFHHIDESIIPNLPASPTLFVSSNSPSGDQNPYGIAYVPPGFAEGGTLNPGDLLVSNFNNSANLQGTGSTIVRITPNGQTSVFFQGPSGIGLTTALGVLKSGFVLVGNVPTTDGTSGTIQAGSLIIVDKNGNEVANLTDSSLLDGPWDLTVNDQGDHAQVFVSNVLSGTVTRIDLTIPDGGNPTVESETQIASGYVHRSDPSALVIGPTGLAYDAHRDILYVASTGDNEIFSIEHAKHRTTDAGMGDLVYQDTVHLHGPLGLLLAPNGNLITANGDAVNADSTQPSEIVEFTRSGDFVGQISINPLPDAAFGIALQFQRPGNELNFAAVDDNTNTTIVWTIDVQNSDDRPHVARPGGASDTLRASTAILRPDLFGAVETARSPVREESAGHLAGSTSTQSAGQLTVVRNANSAPETTSVKLATGRMIHMSAVDHAFADGLDRLWDSL